MTTRAFKSAYAIETMCCPCCGGKRLTCAGCGSVVPDFTSSKFDVERKRARATLKVDYDNDRNPLSVKRIRKVIRELLQTFLKRLEIHRTSKGHHLRMWLEEPISQYLTLALQSKLGDDPMRQQFNASRVRNSKANWNILWNEKHRNGHCTMREVRDHQTELRITTNAYHRQKACAGCGDPFTPRVGWIGHINSPVKIAGSIYCERCSI